MKAVKLVRLGTPGSSSPAIYKTDRGTLLIQGYKIETEQVDGIEGFRPDTEAVIEIPAELVKLLG